jgi:plastocyanin
LTTHDPHGHDPHGHEKEPIILTTPGRFGKAIVLIGITLAIGAAIVINFWAEFHKNPPPVTQIMAAQAAANASAAAPAVAGTTQISIAQGASAQGSKNFDPADAQVPQGNKMVWRNDDTVPHTSTSGTGPSDPNKGKLWDTSLIMPGKSSNPVDTKNMKVGDSIPYFCTVHPYMQAKVTITAAQAGGGASASAGPTIKILAGASAQGSQPYDPKELTAKKGDTVQVINQDTVPHTVTSGSGPSASDNGKLWDTNLIMPAKTAQISLAKVNPGEYDYHCTVHPYMTGKIKVQ